MNSVVTIVKKFGGQTALARLLGKRQSTVQHWLKAGHIPARWQPILLQLARAHGVEVAFADLVEMRAGPHLAQFYHDDAFLIDGVARFVGSALDSGNAAIVLATKPHRDQLVRCLSQRGFDLVEFRRKGLYVALDAAQLLQRFNAGSGDLVYDRFAAILQPLIERANAAATRELPQVAIFGEMVALLWKQRKEQQAIQLEGMWNRLGQNCHFSLLCGYPMEAFSRREQSQGFVDVCRHHADVVPSETFSTLASRSEQNRALARFEQHAQALSAENQRSAARLRLVHHIFGIATWEMDLADEALSLSAEAQQLLGLQDSHRLDLPRFLGTLNSAADQKAFLRAIKQARSRQKEFDVLFRVQRRNRRIRLVRGRGRTVHGRGQRLIVGLFQPVQADAAIPAESN